MNSEEKTILVVDDTEANIDVLVEILGDEYDVSVALDGESALEIAEEIIPDVILLDIMMPEMDGYEVCRRLKANKQTKGIPVIFVTAKGESEEESEGYEIGASDYITKPVDPLLVRQSIEKALGEKE